MVQPVPLPAWLVVVLTVGAPLLVGFGHWLSRKAAREQDVRWRREETMRMLRWAAELAAGADVARRDVGVAALDALDESELLRQVDQQLISAVLDAVVDSAVERYAGAKLTVVEEE